LHRLTHPRSAIPRSYHVALARGFAPLPPELVLRDGHRPTVVDVRAAAEADLHPSLLRPPEATVFASITLADGAYHEVRRIFAALGSHVLSLCRVSFGVIELPRDLEPGDWRPVAHASLLPQKPR
jgi:16S rRNA pseudouridine516 synthase